MQQENSTALLRDVESRYREYLAANNRRYTRERRAMLHAIMQLQGHFSQNDLLAKARKSHKSINRTTVFRNMPEFEKCNIIRRVQAGDSTWRYEHVPGHTHHDHLLCMRCGRLIEIQSPEIENLQSQICRQYGFVEVKHQLCIQGICATCQSR